MSAADSAVGRESVARTRGVFDRERIDWAAALTTVGKRSSVRKTEAGCRTSSRRAAWARSTHNISVRSGRTQAERDQISAAAAAFAAGVVKNDKAIAMKKLVSQLIFLLVSIGVAAHAHAQQLRDVVKQVDGSVVVVKTVEKNLLTAPQTMFVSSPGSGSGVLISTDGKVLTAAHVVRAADKVEVEFADGQTAPAKVISSVPTADVAMLKLDWVPYNARPALLGDSDKMQVGYDVFIIGAPYGIGHSLSASRVSVPRAPKMP